MVENVLLFMSVSIVYMEVSPETGFKFFSSPWAIYRWVTANMKMIQIHRELSPSLFPQEGDLEKRLRVTTPMYIL